MWLLTNVNTGQLFYLLHKKKKYVVGRVGVDIVLKNDTSISRSHACLQFQQDSSSESYTLPLSDLGSKYGTFYNEGIATKTSIQPNQPVELHDGDRIRFGLLENEWTVKKFNWITMTSSLPKENTKELEEYMSSLGGSIINKWEDKCTHLTMAEVTVTLKVLYALLYNVPIVTCEYWRHLLQAAQKSQDSLPKSEMYFPKKNDILKNSKDMDFSFKPERNSIFKGKTFVFMNKKHFDMYGPLVQKASGVCKNLNSGVPKSLLLKPNVVVIQYVPSTQSQSTQTINSIQDFLESNNRRIIPEYEIGLAIINCSTKKYCNPTYNIFGDILPSTMSSAIEQLDTNSINNMQSPGTKVSETDLEIPETDETLTQVNDKVVEFELLANSSGTAGSFKQDILPSEEPSTITSQLKRKRNVNSEDEQPSKKSNLSECVTNKNQEQNKISTFKVEVPTTSKVKALPVVITSKKHTKSTAGFLNKTYQPSQGAKPVSTSTMDDRRSANDGNKRGRIAVITDDSDDENDLFDFGDSTPMNASKRMRIGVPDSETLEASDDEIFTFNKTLPNNASNTSNSDRINTNKEFTNKPLNKKAQNCIPERKVLPKKISTEGWLSCSFNQMKVKDETIKKDELDDDSIENKPTLDLTKGGFEVRLRSISVMSRVKDNSLVDISRVSSNSANNSINYKRFIKKCNYKPQKKIINVIPMPIIPPR